MGVKSQRRKSQRRKSQQRNQSASQTTERRVALLDSIGFEWEPSETAWAKLLAQLEVFKEESGGCTAVPQSWGKKMNKKFGTKEAPDWWSKALGKWTSQQRAFGRAFKKPASKRSPTEKRNAGKTTRRRVALLDGIES